MQLTEKVQIDGFEYEIQKMPPRQGLRVAAKLLNSLAPSVAKLPSEGFKITSPEQLAAILQPLLANPDLGDTLDYLIGAFLPLSTVRDLSAPNGQPVALNAVFDLHFTDRYDALAAWIYQSVRLSMASFLRPGGALAALSQMFAVASKSKSPSSPETTGQSGASP